MNFRNGEEITPLGKLAVGLGMLAGITALGGIIAFAPPSEIEAAREAHQLRRAEKEKQNQEVMAREYTRRLNGG